MGTKGTDVCPCSAQAWPLEVSFEGSRWRGVPGVGLGPLTPVPSAVPAML